MNIEFVKSEIKRLSLIVESWSEGEAVPAVERDLALDKIKSLYEILRFGELEVAAEPLMPSVVPPVVAADVAQEETENQQDDADEESVDNDVEVEFIFAEEDEESAAEDEAEPVDEESDDEVLDIVMPEVEVAAEEPATEPEPMVETTPDVQPEKEVEPVVEQVVEPVVEPAPVVEPTPAPAAEPVQEEKPAVEPVVPPVRKERAADSHKTVASINSLFGVEEPRREPRSKHQRMMSIYNDEAREEKVVDISKIFDMDDDDDEFEITTVAAPKPQPRAKRTEELYDEPVTFTETIADVKTVTLGDAMAQNSTTLADTIAAPAALGEEINHSHIKSLRKAIGINDKFLMIRDLFEGDGDAYEQTLGELDAFESFDDCLLYIAENHPEWNPDSEGAKFLTQLLERKLL